MKRVLIYASILFVTLTAASGLYFYRTYMAAKRNQEIETPLRMISQTGPMKGALKTDYLAALIGKSPLRDADKALLKNPVIKKVKTTILSPGVLSIDYTVRKPYVWLADYENIACDHEAYPLPFSPFYTPKNMPAIILGDTDLQWDQRLSGEKIELAFDLLNELKKDIDFFSIETIDVSAINHSSLGRREVVIALKKETGRHYLRLDPCSLKDQWRRYLMLELDEGDHVIDLRLDKLAYIKEVNHD